VNSYDVRVYGMTYTPDFFKKYGWRGWWVRVLNAIRYHAELRCRYHALTILGKVSGADPEYLEAQMQMEERQAPSLLREIFRPSTATSTPSVEPPLTEKTVTAQFSRYTAQGRSRRYRGARRTFSLYESEVIPYGREQQESRSEEPSHDSQDA
jgi:hypothetical protein